MLYKHLLDLPNVRAKVVKPRPKVVKPSPPPIEIDKEGRAREVAFNS